MDTARFVSTLPALREALETRGQFLELWVERDDGQRMALLLNGNRGWLMHLRFEGDSGFHSQNPAHSGTADLEMEFLLGNGQLDRYPVRWTFDLEPLQRTLEHFFETGQGGNWVVWIED